MGQPDFLAKPWSKVSFSPPFDAWYRFPFIAPEGDIFVVDIPVAGFQFLNQFAFWDFSIAYQTVIPHIIRKGRD